MKKQYFFAVLLLLLCMQNTRAQWIRIITAEQSSPLSKVQTVTPMVVYAANNYGRQLYRSGDGGNTWAYTTGQIANTYPNAFYFTSADTGFVVGDKGYIYKTVNGGASYTVLPRPYQHYKDITFTSKTTGYIVGNGRMNVQPADSAFILKTTDGGATWSYFNLGHIENMTAITFFDENNGCAVGNMGRIHVTNDGGVTWSPKVISNTNTLYDVAMPSANVIYAAGYNVFIQSVNGGNNWTNVNTGQTGFPTYSGMYFSDSANGYVTYPSGLLTKQNSVWSRFAKISTSLLHVHFLNATTGFATGNDGHIYKYVGNTQILAIGDPQSGKSLFRKQNYNITWSSNAIDTIMIEYRVSPSSPWQTLSAKEPASRGYYMWNVPDVEASEVSVRITDVANSANTSKTADNISITLEKNVLITSPYKYSASLIAGKKLRIAWTSLNIDTVKIEYRMNSNLPWVNIANKVNAHNRSYLFALPATATRNLQFKVSAVADSRYADSTFDGKLRAAAINVNDPIWSLQNPKPFLGSLKDAQFIDANTIYALADPNLFVKSTDKGATWSIVKTLPADGETFRALHFINANLGYVLMGDDYTTNLYKTTDAGLNWILTHEGLPGTAKNMQFANADSGWVSGGDYSGATLMFTTNGGLTFTAQYTKATRTIKDLFVINSQKAWLVSEDGFLMKTNNSGITWDSITKINYPLNDLHFIGSNGWAVGGDFSNGRVLLTTDNGVTWTVKNITGGGMDAIAMKDAANGYAIAVSGSSSTFFKKTTDGGNTWTNINAYVNPTGSLPFASKLLIASNDVGIAFKKESYNTDAASYFTLSGSNVSAWNPITPELHKNANLNIYGLNAGITMIDSTTGYAMSRYLVKTTNGGTNWNIASTTEFFTNTSHMQFIAKDTGFVCGEKGGNRGIFRTTDGGASWSLMRSTGSVAPFRIHFADKLNGFALPTNYDSLYKTTDGGLTWTSIAKPSSTNQGLYFIDANKGYVFGTSLYSTNNGGATWSLINLNMDAGAYLTRVRFFNSTTGYAVGYYGNLPNNGLCAYIFKTTDGGSTWTRQICPSIGGDMLRDVHFIDADNGFASGEGMILQTTDGGANWHISALPIPNGSTSYSISALTFTDTRNGWAVVGNNQSNIIMKCNFKAPVIGPPVPAITLNAPNGGEVFSAGSTQNIVWSSSNIDSIKVQYRAASTAQWTTLATVPSSSNMYAWVVPAVASTTVSVKVSAANNAAVADSSNASFTITIPVNPMLTLSAPDGGESYTIGSSQNITWTALNIDSIVIEYRTSATSSWQHIARVAAASSNYVWVIPNAPTNAAMVRITSTNNMVADSSNATFSIVQASSPMLNLLDPDGGELWFTGSSQGINWTSALIDTVVIEYSTGADYMPVATVAAASGTYSWLIPNTPSTTCRVRIKDKLNMVIDSSAGNFEIRNSTGLNDLVKETGLLIYPNPFETAFTLELNMTKKEEVLIFLFDIAGKQIDTQQETVETGKQKLTIQSDAPAGIYFAHITINGKTAIQKVVKLK